MSDAGGFFKRVYVLVRRIPRGRVATYGQIARLAGAPGAARTVGWALHALPKRSGVPWHRVINARGGISTSCLTHPADEQKLLLIEEGIRVTKSGMVDLARYQWSK